MGELSELQVLFLHNNPGEYLTEALFHGLRSLLGTNCVDVPRYDCTYAPLDPGIRAKLRGQGFTLYGLLDDIPELVGARHFWKLDLDRYDLIVIGNIWEQWHHVFDLAPDLPRHKLALLDGSDTAACFPFNSFGWRLRRHPTSYLTPVWKFPYFKRELVGAGVSYSLDRVLPRALRSWIPVPSYALPISYAIPAAKITRSPLKDKDFPTHIVDAEVAENVRGFYSAVGSDRYTFTSEADYYRDLQRSRFGITTKRAGWDCLRHYELAANGCVLCFRDLDRKPATCAPHGLDASNAIVYRDWNDLKRQIDALSEDDYNRLQANTYAWIDNHTTVALARRFLSACAAAAPN